MNWFSRRVSGILVSWLCAGSVSAVYGQQYPYLPVAGSPKTVKSLFQDSHGRLWLGGLDPACFDGSRFFFLHDYGFPAGEAYDFAEDPSGAMWIAAETGAYRFAAGRVEELAKGVAVSVIPASADIAVAAMGPSGRGLPGKTSLVRIWRAGRAWKSETILPLDSPGPLSLDASGMLLYPISGKGWSEIRLADVVAWKPGGAVRPLFHPIAPFPDNGYMSVMRDHAGCLWMGFSGATGYDCGNGVRGAISGTQSKPHEALDGTLVLTGYDLLESGRPGSFRTATRANGLVGAINAISAKDGTIWLATTLGLYRFASPFRSEYWTIREGLSGVPWSIARSGGRVYAGTSNSVVALSNDRLRWDTVAHVKEGGLVSGLLATEDGGLLATRSAGGVLKLSRTGAVIAQTEKGEPAESMRVARTPDGKIWLGDGGIGTLTRQGSTLKLERQPLETHPSGNVLAIKYEEHTRKLWACYNGGLVSRDQHGVWKEYTTRDGLLVNGCWSLVPLPNGDVWYAYFQAHAHALIRPTADGGVTVRQYGPESGVPEPGGDTLDADQRGWLWRGSDQSIYVADPAEAEAGQWLPLDGSDGFPANDMNSGSVFVDDDGSLWWGADNDLAHYTPSADLVRPQFAPQVFVSAFSWDGGAPRLAEAVASLPHGAKVTVHIGSLQFERRHALQLRYRLLPEQQQWRETRSLDLALGKLSSGAHTLEVQGRVFTGPWSNTVSRSFTVLLPVGLTWPLVAAYCMVAISFATGAYLLHRRHRAEDMALLPDLAAWRMRALLPEVQELEGTLLDSRFQVGGLLARGGFANVLDGFDAVQKQRCAIKVFRGEVKDKAWVERRFEQEVAALKKVRHANVVSIYAHGTAPSGAPYLIMEFVDGRNLREVLESGPLPPRRTARILQQLAGALDAIHALEICHRDVKPENIIVRREGTAEEAPVLIDFSIAIVKDANETLHGLSRAAGSFDYMAPEQAVGYAEPSSDIYSLAKLVIEMLTGRQLRELLPDAALDLPERVRELAAGLEVRFSPASIDMLAAALQFDPKKRPNSAGWFAAPLVRDLE